MAGDKYWNVGSGWGASLLFPLSDSLVGFMSVNILEILVYNSYD